MWCSGCLLGLISKEDSETILGRSKPGSFLIRFSNTNAGVFAVAFTDTKRTVRHLLVQREWISKERSLADYLEEHPEYKYLLALDITDDEIRSDDKNEVLADFYSEYSPLNSIGYINKHHISKDITNNKDD